MHGCAAFRRYFSSHLRCFGDATHGEQLPVRRGGRAERAELPEHRVWRQTNPPGVAAQKRYPVLYMLDGQNLFDLCTAGGNHREEWRIDETLTRLIGSGAIEPLIVVEIDTPCARRYDEYMP